MTEKPKQPRPWIASAKATTLAWSFAGLALGFQLFDIGIGMFGGAHARLLKTIPQGYVPITVDAKGGSSVWYVKPWVAQLHNCVAFAELAAFISAGLLGFGIWIAKAGLPKE